MLCVHNPFTRRLQQSPPRTQVKTIAQAFKEEEEIVFGTRLPHAGPPLGQRNVSLAAVADDARVAVRALLARLQAASTGASAAELTAADVATLEALGLLLDGPGAVARAGENAAHLAACAEALGYAELAASAAECEKALI